MTPDELPAPRDAKKDSRPQLGAWAPGNYMCVCSVCTSKFIGDKRAKVCADCAYENTVLAGHDSKPDAAACPYNRSGEGNPCYTCALGIKRKYRLECPYRRLAVAARAFLSQTSVTNRGMLRNELAGFKWA